MEKKRARTNQESSKWIATLPLHKWGNSVQYVVWGKSTRLPCSILEPSSGTLLTCIYMIVTVQDLPLLLRLSCPCGFFTYHHSPSAACKNLWRNGCCSRWRILCSHDYTYRWEHSRRRHEGNHDYTPKWPLFSPISLKLQDFYVLSPTFQAFLLHLWPLARASPSLFNFTSSTPGLCFLMLTSPRLSWLYLYDA